MQAKTDKLNIKFGKRDEAKEDEIRKQEGSYLELCPHGLFFYPDDKKAYLKLLRSITDQQDILKSLKGAHIICHSWGTSQSGNNRPGICKFYRHNFSWLFGEAEYQGRKNGAAIWETEDKLLNDIKKDIVKAIPKAEVYMKTKFGQYRIKVYNCKRGDKDKLNRIKRKYQSMYPKDVFYFDYKANISSGC